MLKKLLYKLLPFLRPHDPNTCPGCNLEGSEELIGWNHRLGEFRMMVDGMQVRSKDGIRWEKVE